MLGMCVIFLSWPLWTWLSATASQGPFQVGRPRFSTKPWIQFSRHTTSADMKSLRSLWPRIQAVAWSCQEWIGVEAGCPSSKVSHGTCGTKQPDTQGAGPRSVPQHPFPSDAQGDDHGASARCHQQVEPISSQNGDLYGVFTASNPDRAHHQVFPATVHVWKLLCSPRRTATVQEKYDGAAGAGMHLHASNPGQPPRWTCIVGPAHVQNHWSELVFDR